MQIENHPIDYTAQSVFSDPGPYHHLFDALPSDAQALVMALHGFFAIDLWPTIGFPALQQEQETGSSTHRVREKLARLLEIDPSPLNKERSMDQCIMGNCRDASLLLCAMLRHKGIAARLRSGFATFFDPARKMDHWVCEYWDSQEERWIKIDSWMSEVRFRQTLLPPPLREGLANLEMDPLDVAPAFFISGGQAWKNIRFDNEDADGYGSYGELHGDWFVRDNMLRDGLCLLGNEVLPWDCWGLMGGRERPTQPEDLALLDRIAALTLAADTSIEELAALYRSHAQLQVPENILNP